MTFFFVRDYLRNYRYFSSQPSNQIEIKFSRPRKIWELAKEKLMLLPQRVLRQEQAFGRVTKLREKKIEIYHSGCLDERKIKIKFYFFMQKQRTKHVLFLAGEALLLPLSGLAALLPGPNVFFGSLALLMITHWQALRGINKTLRKKHEFIATDLLTEWEKAVDSKEEMNFPQILKKIEKKFNLGNIQRVLWK